MRKTSAFKRFLRSKTMPLILILVVMALFTMVKSSGVLNGEPISAMFTKGFLSKGNLLSVFYNLVIQMVMMCGLGCILISGNIDLSVGAQAALSTMVFAWLCANSTMGWGFAFLLTLILSLVFGLINTLLVNKLKFPAFIATIGMSSVYKGLCSIMTGGYNIQVSRESFVNFGTASIGGVLPYTFIVALVFLIACQYMLSRTRFGRSIFMAGGNPAAARLSGLNPDRIRMIMFLLNSVMACIGGLLWTAQIKVASPTAIITAAPDMQVISAAILGGVAFTGGSGNLIAGFVGLLLLNVFENMLNVLGVQSYWTVFAQGLVLAVALIIDFASNQRRHRAQLAAAAAAEDAA